MDFTMKNTFATVSKSENDWQVKGTDAIVRTYRTKNEALQEARKLAKSGIVVFVHDKSGEIKDVLGVNGPKTPPILRSPVKHRLKSRQINIAIAKIIEESYAKELAECCQSMT